jgi:hypothetical protein
MLVLLSRALDYDKRCIDDFHVMRKTAGRLSRVVRCRRAKDHRGYPAAGSLDKRGPSAYNRYGN